MPNLERPAARLSQLTSNVTPGRSRMAHHNACDRHLFLVGCTLDRHFRTCRLPPTPQRSVQSNQGERTVALALRKRVLGRIERAFRIEHGQEAFNALLLEKPRSVGGFGLGGHFGR
jgi:hypothetical protein